MIKNRVEYGWNAYFCTFMFKSLSGNRNAISAQMLDEIDRVYSTFITRVVRDPKRCGFYAKLDVHFDLREWDDKRPVLIACLDGFSKKCDKKNRVRVDVNDGLHVHGIMVVPPVSGLKEPLNKHFDRCKRIYVKNLLRRIDVQQIESNEYFVVDYGQKALKNGRADFDDIGIWPRAHDEPRGRSSDQAP